MLTFDGEADLFEDEDETGLLDGELELGDDVELDGPLGEVAFESLEGGDLLLEPDSEDLGELDGETMFELGADNELGGALLESDPEIVGVDTRKVVPNTTRIPFRFICHLSMGCTGTLVAPNKVLTSAHCVYDRSSKRPTWSGTTAAPGRNGRGSSRRDVPYGTARIIRANFPRAYVTARSYNAAWPHDYAVLTLDRRFAVPGGAFSRLRVIDPNVLLKVKVNTAGYPGHGSRRQYWTYNRIVSISGARMRHVLDTKPGQSGSPIWLRWRKTRSIVGIHKAGFRGSPQQNRGVVFTTRNLAEIKRWNAR